MRETWDRTKSWKYLYDLANILDATGRIGEDEDSPEGVRFIQVSDTLAKQISMRLKRISEYIGPCPWCGDPSFMLNTPSPQKSRSRRSKKRGS